MADTDQIDFSEPTTSTTDGADATAPVIDPATGEPTLAPAAELASVEVPVTETPKTEPEKKPETAPDADAALAVAAKTNRENRDLRKQNEALANELKALKEKPADTALSEKAALADAFIKNPSLLLKHGWAEDKLMKHLLDPDASVGPMTQDEINRLIQEGIEARLKKTPEQEKAENEAAQSAYQQNFANAVKVAEGEIAKVEKDCYYVKSDDAHGIIERVVKHFNDKGITPTNEQAIALIGKGIKGLQFIREKKYGKREVTATAGGSAQNPSNMTEELGFTVAKKPQFRPITPQPTVPSSNGSPLPTKRQPISIGFTNE